MAGAGELTGARVKKGVKQKKDFSYTVAIQQPTGAQTPAVEMSQLFDHWLSLMDWIKMNKNVLRNKYGLVLLA